MKLRPTTSIMSESSKVIFLFADRICKLSFDFFSLFTHMSHKNAFHSVITVLIVAITLASAIIAQLARFVVQKIEMHLVVDSVPIVAMLIIPLVSLLITYTDKEKYDKMYVMVQEDCAEKKSEQVMKIRQKYNQFTILIIKSLTLTAIILATMIALSGFIPQILDSIMPLNESRPRTLPFYSLNFLDEQKYFYVLLCYEYLTILVMAAVATAIENQFILIIQQICGMFAEIGCEMEQIDFVHRDAPREGMEYERTIMSNIQISANKHQKILNYIALIKSSAKVLTFLLLIMTIVSLSILLVQVTNIELIDVRAVVLATALIAQFYIISHMSQSLINESEDFSYKVYNAKWYKCPVKAQKLFIFLLLRSYKTCSIVAGNVVVMCLQNFGAVIQTAVSYCMVLRQFQ